MPEVCLYVPRQLDTHKHTPRQSGIQSILSRARGSEKVQSPCGRCQAGAPCRQSLSAKVPQKRMSRWESKGDRSSLGRILLPSPVYSSLKEVEEKAHKNGETPTA